MSHDREANRDKINEQNHQYYQVSKARAEAEQIGDVVKFLKIMI